MTEISKVEKLSFIAEWFDVEASVIRKFLFTFFPSDCTIELFDVKNHKLFLKRTQCNELTQKDVFVGNTVKIFSRQVKIVDYADTITRKKLGESMQKTFGMIKPDGMASKGEIICSIYKQGFQISRLKMTKIDKELAAVFYKDHQGKQYFPSLIDHVTSGPVICMDLLAQGAVHQWLEFIGPTDPEEAKSKFPGSIRAQFGTDIIRNVAHSAKTSEDAVKESSLIFEPQANKYTSLKPVAQMVNSTCCVIKPHAVQAGLPGEIICMIEKNGFLVTAMNLYYLEEINAAEFLEVYKGVVPEYMSMVKQLSSGPCLAMEVSSTKPGCNVPVEFRQFVGPSDPEIAREIRPHTIRAHYGKTKIENAVHVTDLPEDAILELEYFFKILPP